MVTEGNMSKTRKASNYYSMWFYQYGVDGPHDMIFSHRKGQTNCHSMSRDPITNRHYVEQCWLFMSLFKSRAKQVQAKLIFLNFHSISVPISSQIMWKRGNSIT